MQISVVIPLYNKKEQICRALNSVLSQSFQPLEIIVVNDGSTDGSEKLVEGLNHPLVNLVHQTNAGVSAARNKGIELSNGEWIAFLDADDEWMPMFLESIISLHNSYPNSKVLGAAYKNYLNSKIQNDIKLKKLSNYKYQVINYFKIASFSSPPICSSAVVIEKSSLLKIGGFPIGIIAGEDLLTWSKLAKNNEFAYCSIGLARYYIENEIIHRADRLKLIIENNQKVTTEFRKILDVSEKYERLYLAEWYKIISLQYLRLSLNKQAFYAILNSIYLRPFRLKIYIYMLLWFMPFLRHRIIK